MCGMVGIFNFDKRPIDKKILERMTASLTHRGPDDTGFFIEGSFGLGHRRLSIIDPSPSGHQPMSNIAFGATAEETIWVAHNGEIYNYRQLRSELEGLSYKFRSQSDTEVIIYSYAEWGIECFKHFNGMFAIAIWDALGKKLLLARDRLGIKPLYYWQDAKKFLFASEIKAILKHPEIKREINLNALSDYFTFLYVPEPKTIFENIYALEPATIKVIQSDRTSGKCKLETIKYWAINSQPIELETTEESLLNTLDELLNQAVCEQLVSDVPFGCFLSGGIDSSLVTAIMSRNLSEPVKTFSVGYDLDAGIFNELNFAATTAQFYRTEHYELLVKPKIIDQIPKLIWHLDQPLADTSFFLTYLVSELASEKVKMVLTGIGADELFAGYNRYFTPKAAFYYNKIPAFLRGAWLKKAISYLPEDRSSRILDKFRLLKRFLSLADLPPEQRYLASISYFDEQLKAQLFSNQVIEKLGSYQSADQNLHLLQGSGSTAGNGDFVNRMLVLDLHTWLLSDLLFLCDRMSMANSLEARVPMLDHRLVEWAFSLPSCLKIKGFTLKYLLKKVASRYLPENLIKRPKQGFCAPIGLWIKTALRQSMQKVIFSPPVLDSNLFKISFLDQMLQEHLEDHQDYSLHLFAVYIFSIWLQIFINNEDPNQVNLYF